MGEVASDHTGGAPLGKSKEVSARLFDADSSFAGRQGVASGTESSAEGAFCRDAIFHARARCWSQACLSDAHSISGAVRG